MGSRFNGKAAGAGCNHHSEVLTFISVFCDFHLNVVISISALSSCSFVILSSSWIDSEASLIERGITFEQGTPAPWSLQGWARPLCLPFPLCTPEPYWWAAGLHGLSPCCSIQGSSVGPPGQVLTHPGRDFQACITCCGLTLEEAFSHTESSHLTGHIRGPRLWGWWGWRMADSIWEGGSVSCGLWVPLSSILGLPLPSWRGVRLGRLGLRWPSEPCRADQAVSSPMSPQQRGLTMWAEWKK